MNAGEAVGEILRLEGVEQVFCFPSNPLIDGAAKAGIRPVVARQERAVVNMADAFTRVRKGASIGVVMVQSGPGAEHAFGGVAQAYSDSVPLLVLTGGVARRQLGLRSAFDSVAAFGPITKWAGRFNTAASVPSQLRRAYALLRSGRPGPVLLEMPADVVGEELDAPLDYRPPVRTRSQAEPAAIAEAARLLLAAERPLLHAGQGILWAGATDELVELAELVGAPVMTSYVGKSAFPERHRLAVGAGGAAVSPGIRRFLPEADLVFSVGASLLHTLGSVAMPAGTPIVQANADPDELGREYPIVCGLAGDAKLVLAQLCAEVRAAGGAGRAWGGRAAEEVAATRAAAEQEWGALLASDEVPISPFRVVGELMAALDPARTIVTHDSGYPRDHLAPFYEADVPGSYLGWGNTTPLGSSLGLALGASLGAPDKVVVNFMGDAAFGQSGLDLETAVRYGLKVVTVLINNYEMGNYEKMQPVAQERFDIKRLSGEFTPVAKALGAWAEQVTKPDELAGTVPGARAVAEAGRPALVEIITRADARVVRI